MGNFISFEDEQEEPVEGKPRKITFNDVMRCNHETLGAVMAQSKGPKWVPQQEEPNSDERLTLVMRWPADKNGTQQTLYYNEALDQYSLVKTTTFNRGSRVDASLREIVTALRVGRLAADEAKAVRYLGIPNAVKFNGQTINMRLAKADMNLMTFMNSKCDSATHIGELLLFLLLQVARALSFIHNDLEAVLGNLTPESIMVRDTNTIPTIFITSLKHLVKAVPREQLERNFAFAARSAGVDVPERGVPDRDRRDAGFAAPEVAEVPEAFATQAGDVWAFGAIMLWLVSGQIIGRNPNENWKQYLDSITRITSTQGTTLKTFIADILDMCVEITCDPRSRPGGPACIMKLLDALPDEAGLQYLKLMRHCLQRKPSDRPRMADVVSDLLFTRQKVGKFASTSQLLDIIEDVDPLTDTQHMRRHLMEEAELVKRVVAAAKREQVHPHAVSAAFEDDAGAINFSKHLVAARQQIGTSMHSQLMRAAPELESAVTTALVEGLAHADSAVMSSKTKVNMKEYGANLLAGFDFALNVGSELPFETRRKVLKHAAASLERNGIPLSVEEALQTQDNMLYTQSAVMFADNEVLSDRRGDFNSKFLASALESQLSTLDFIKTN